MRDRTKIVTAGRHIDREACRALLAWSIRRIKGVIAAIDPSNRRGNDSQEPLRHEHESAILVEFGSLACHILGIQGKRDTGGANVICKCVEVTGVLCADCYVVIDTDWFGGGSRDLINENLTFC